MSLDQLFVLKNKPTIAVPFPQDHAVLFTMKYALDHNWADFLLIGDRSIIIEAARNHGIDGASMEILPASQEDEACQIAAQAIAEGRASAAMKGAVHSGTFSKAMFSSTRGLMNPGRLGSHVGILDLPVYPKPLFLTDCAININPTYEQKIEILRNVLELAQTLGVQQPKVGLLAPVETVNPKIPSTVDAQRLKEAYHSGELKDLPKGAILDGPFGIDVALSAEAARIKGIPSQVAGDVDILLFPDLTSGNVAYKTFTFAGKGTIAGVLTGARIPQILTSRADSDQTKLLALRLGVSLAGG